MIRILIFSCIILFCSCAGQRAINRLKHQFDQSNFAYAEKKEKIAKYKEKNIDSYQGDTLRFFVAKLNRKLGASKALMESSVLNQIAQIYSQEPILKKYYYKWKYIREINVLSDQIRYKTNVNYSCIHLCYCLVTVSPADIEKLQKKVVDSQKNGDQLEEDHLLLELISDRLLRQIQKTWIRKNLSAKKYSFIGMSQCANKNKSIEKKEKMEFLFAITLGAKILSQ
ncbi:MAG: hypothetical protein EP338_07890 [Bacteroidetes bacterium]|nr:MAG: hypothetical protein EP338_07890 [Bacteroidota bacterium]